MHTLMDASFVLGCGLERERQVSHDWWDAILLPVPKKGNLYCCDNCRGISLLDVVGKLLGKIMQSYLQKLAEKVLPESQCWLQKGCSCMDIIFRVSHLTKKHNMMQYFAFVDLCKMYDSVPRVVLWRVLLKMGIPKELVELVKSSKMVHSYEG